MSDKRCSATHPNQPPCESGARRTPFRFVWPTIFQHLLTALCAFTVLPIPASVSQLTGTVLAAESTDQPQADLETITAAIAEIQLWIEEAGNTYSAEETGLRSAELQISDTSQKIAEVEAALAETREEQARLNSRLAELNEQKSTQSTLLQEMLKAAYLRGNESMLKLLLNQEDLGKSARLLHYYRVFSEAQLKTVQEFEVTLAEISTAEAGLQTAAQRLAMQQEGLQEQLRELEQNRATRESALLLLQSRIAARSAELEQLQIDQAQLQELVNEIQRQIERIPVPSESASLSARRGSLVQPVPGAVVQEFGSQYGDSNLRRQGITIAASEGTPVRAVHAGRVVFADWLRGSGLLVIVDHGEGYMSLYGRNQALSKAAGDRVATGEILATAGNSGDGGAPGLYFEIRYRGAPQDPADWLVAPE